jgi:hypothetical protein
MRESEKEECAIIAYPSHYNTEHIVGVIKDYIDEKFHSNILSLIPINKDRNGTAYLISPLIIERIRQKIIDFKKSGKKAKVLLFDEATIEGKTRKELKHLLFHLGADDVKTLCVLDRQRLPFSTSNPEKHKAYWRLDIPRLGNKDNCMLCKSLDVINSFKNALIYSRDKFRVEQWKTAWESRFPYSKGKFHGLISKPLNQHISEKFAIYIDKTSGKELHYDYINLINSVGLTLYAGETHSMTGRDDMALKLCQDAELNSLSKIEILSTNLLLFGKDFAYQESLKMLKLIFNEINSLEKVSNETALGVLTILSQPEETIKSLFEQSSNKENNDIEIKNLDLELLLCFYSQNKDSVFSNLSTLRRHFGSQYISDIRTVYFKFHHELHNDFGRIHNTSLEKTLSLKEYTQLSIETIRLSISSCEKIYDLINLFPFWNTRQLYSKKDAEETKTQILTLTSLLQKHSEKIIENQQNNPTIDVYVGSNELLKELCEIKSSIENVKKQLYYLHSLLFTNIGIQNYDSFPLKDELSKIISFHSQYNSTHKIKFDDFIKKAEPEYERWVPWDKQISNKVSYIIDNVKHSIGFLDASRMFYKEMNAEQSLANMLISVKYLTKGLQLIFENYSERSHENIILKAQGKNKPEKQHIYDLGGQIIYESDQKDENLYLIRTILELPYQ